jgi:hypothetical protein
MQACILSQAALADWKAHSIYAGEQWAIGRIKCVPGDYVIKGADDLVSPALWIADHGARPTTNFVVWRHS